jgi:hypothetical protein
MNDQPTAGEDTFSESDLGPNAHDIRQARRHLGERIATGVAATCCGVWAGGLIALGACAAPLVFERTPYPHSGDAMIAVFARFDRLAIGLAVLVLGCEAARTLLTWQNGQFLAARVRRYLAILAALGAVFSATRLTPAIQSLYSRGARRGLGEAGRQFEALHAQSEMIGKATVVIAIALIFLHIFTLRGHQDDEADDVLAPLPPGGSLP